MASMIAQLKKFQRMRQRLEGVFRIMGEVKATDPQTTAENYRAAGGSLCGDFRVRTWLERIPQDQRAAFERYAPLFIWGLDVLAEE